MPMHKIVFHQRQEASVQSRASRKRGDHDDDDDGPDKHDKDSKHNHPPPPGPPSPPNPAGPPNPRPAGKPLPLKSSPASTPNSASSKPASNSDISTLGGQRFPVSTRSPLAYSYSSSSNAAGESVTKSNGFESTPPSFSTSIFADVSSATVTPNDTVAARNRTINIAAITGAVLAAIFILVAIRVLYAMFRRPKRPTNSGSNYRVLHESFPNRSSPSMDTPSIPVTISSQRR